MTPCPGHYTGVPHPAHTRLCRKPVGTKPKSIALEGGWRSIWDACTFPRDAPPVDTTGWILSRSDGGVGESYIILTFGAPPASRRLCSTRSQHEFTVVCHRRTSVTSTCTSFPIPPVRH